MSAIGWWRFQLCFPTRMQPQDFNFCSYQLLDAIGKRSYGGVSATEEVHIGPQYCRRVILLTPTRCNRGHGPQTDTGWHYERSLDYSYPEACNSALCFDGKCSTPYVHEFDFGMPK